MSVTRISTKDLFVCIGKILKPFGTEGQLKVQNFSDIADRFHTISTVYIGPTINLAAPYSIESVHEHNRKVILTLHNYTSRDAAESLHGFYCYVPKLDRESLDDDSFYVEDLLGLKVITTEGAFIGTITDVLSIPANDVLAVRTNDKEVLVPMVGEIVKVVNMEEGTITISPIDGLLETFRAD